MARRPLQGLFTLAIASAAFAAMAGTAHATTSTTVSGSKTVSNTATSWTGKNTKYGEFGAGYSVGYTLYSNDTGSSKYESVSASSSAKLFGESFSLLDATAKASAGLSSSVSGSYSVKIAGATVGYASSLALSSSSLSLDIPCVTLAEAESTVMIVVVPVTLGLSAEACPGLSLSSSGSYSSTQSSISFTGTPSLSADLTASVGVGVSGFSVGAEVGVTLISLALPVTSSMSFVPSTKALTYANAGTLTLESLAGSVSLYAKAWPLKYTYTLFDWDGIGGSWVIFSDSVPTAASATATISDFQASGTYTFTDPSNLDDSGSSYVWYRASDASGTGSTSISTAQNRSLSTDDNGKYLKFCVTPRNGVNTGAQACSGWTSVGHIAELFTAGSSGGTNLSVAYEHSLSGTCINVNTAAFNDQASSLQFYAPTSSSATLWLFQHADCGGDSTSVGASANSHTPMDSMRLSLGDAWNDSVSSIMVVYGETVSAEDVSVTVSGNKATSSHSFVSNSNLEEDGTTYYWQRAIYGDGYGAATINSSNSDTHALVAADNDQYLRICVTPSNGYTTGSATCSGWTHVGHVVSMYKDSSYGNTDVSIAYEKAGSGNCYNLGTYSFNDAMSSFKFFPPSSSSATFQVFYDSNCSGNGAYYTESASGAYLMSSLNSYWNDNASSFKVTW